MAGRCPPVHNGTSHETRQSQLIRGVQDLATLGRRHGMPTVHLRLAFARGLHPFYPPSLEASVLQS